MNKVAPLLLMIIIVVSSGCITDTQDEQAAPGYPITIVDGIEREVDINKAPERIVSLAPNNTEILCAIDACDLIVGITDSCNYPPCVEDKQRLGQLFDAKHTNFEAIIALEPDVAFAIDGQPEVIARLEELGITTVVISTQRLDDIAAAISLAGEVLDRSDEAQQLVTDINEQREQIEQAVATTDNRPVVLFEIWPDPLMVAGPNTFLNDLIELSGGINIAHDAGEQYPMMSREIVLERNPEVIITTFTATLQALTDSDHEWSIIDAVTNDRIVLVEEDIVARPGPRIIQAMDMIARAIQPDLFD